MVLNKNKQNMYHSEGEWRPKICYGWSLVKCHVMYAMNADALSNNKLIDHDIYHIPYFFLHTVC